MSGWWYSVTDESGTFTAAVTINVDNDGGGGGDGGGGCFISTMIE